jgi:dTDP-4-dehydrorhamnose reductase
MGELFVKIAVNGAEGQLGRDVVKACWKSGHYVYAFDKNKWDITHPSHSKKWLEYIQPNVLIHCAAYTKVDEAEKNPSLSYAINAIALEEIAKTCNNLSIKLIYISTDYVFDGAKSSGYVENDETNPLNQYGRSKLEGEQKVAQWCPNSLVLRTSWLFGVHGHNFVRAILQKAKQKEHLRVVSDQIGCPTFTRHLAYKIVSLLETDDQGIRHTAGSGSCSWYQFAKEICELSSLDVSIQPIYTKDLALPAIRPANSVLLSTKTSPLPSWQSGLKEYLKLVGEPK